MAGIIVLLKCHLGVIFGQYQGLARDGVEELAGGLSIDVGYSGQSGAMHRSPSEALYVQLGGSLPSTPHSSASQQIVGTLRSCHRYVPLPATLGRNVHSPSGPLPPNPFASSRKGHV